MNWIIFFWVILKSVLFSTGGFGPLPSLHTDLISHGWASERHFTEALSIGQVTPGPNGLWVVSLSFLIAGIPGAVLACIALILPPLLIVIVRHCYNRISKYPATQGVLDGVLLVIVGFNVIVLAGIFKSNGIDIVTVAVFVVSAVLAVSRKVSANIILLAAAILGIILG